MTIEEFGTEQYALLVSAIMRALDVTEDRILPEARFEEDLEADSFDMAAVLMEEEDASGTEKRGK